MPASPSTEPLDDRLTDMGRALASSLLGDIDVARPTRRPRAAAPTNVADPVTPTAPAPSVRASPPAAASSASPSASPSAAPAAGAPAGILDPAEPPTHPDGTPLSRRERREIRERLERETAAATVPASTVAPPTAPRTTGAVVGSGRAPARPDDPTATPATTDGTHFQVARPRQRPAPPVDARGSRPADRTRPAPSSRAAREPSPEPGPSASRTAAFAPAARPPRPTRPTTTSGAAADATVVRPRVRGIAPDPFAALPWPVEETAFSRAGSRRPAIDERIREHEVLAPVPAADTEDEGDIPPRSTVRSIVEWAVVLGSAAIVALVLQHFVVQLYEIPSESMFPTLKEDDRVLVNKLAYSVGGGVEQGDVIVFKRPASERTDDPGQPPQLIKRVVGLPGDVVEARGGVVYINGKPLVETGSEGYLDVDVVTNNLPEAVTVEPGHVFVMGDNRERSHDSRFFGAIPESDIIGRAVVVAWPSDRWGTL